MFGLVFFASLMAVFGIVTAIAAADNKCRPRTLMTALTVEAILFGGFSWGVEVSVNERDATAAKAEAAWVAAGCPTYASECGGKYKYACERKAASVGRNRVGDIFVEAKATCNQ